MEKLNCIQNVKCGQVWTKGKRRVGVWVAIRVFEKALNIQKELFERLKIFCGSKSVVEVNWAFDAAFFADGVADLVPARGQHMNGNRFTILKPKANGGFQLTPRTVNFTDGQFRPFIFRRHSSPACELPCIPPPAAKSPLSRRLKAASSLRGNVQTGAALAWGRRSCGNATSAQREAQR